MIRVFHIMLVFALCTPFLLPGAASAQSEAEEPVIRVYGMHDVPCSEYRPTYQVAISRDDWRGMSDYLSYFSGFITGLNIAEYPSDNPSGNLLGPVGIKGFAGAVDRFCSENPMETVFLGIMDAISALSDRSGQR